MCRNERGELEAQRGASTWFVHAAPAHRAYLKASPDATDVTPADTPDDTVVKEFCKKPVTLALAVPAEENSCEELPPPASTSCATGGAPAPAAAAVDGGAPADE